MLFRSISICNFRRYGWSTASHYNAKTGYANDIIFPNAQYTHDPSDYRDDEEMHRCEVARLIGRLERTEDSQVVSTMFSRAAQKGFEYLIQNALKHTQMKSDHRTCSMWGDEKDIELVINNEPEGEVIDQGITLEDHSAKVSANFKAYAEDHM